MRFLASDRFGKPSSRCAWRSFVWILVALPLAGCPIPLPVCEHKELEVLQVPAVDVRSPHVAEILADAGFVFGRIDLRGAESSGRISLTLVAVEDGEPKAERRLWLQADGGFAWALPAGTYAIASAAFNYDYWGTSYQKSRDFNPKVSFRVTSGPAIVYLGNLRISIDDDTADDDASQGPYAVHSPVVTDAFAADRSIVFAAGTLPPGSEVHRLMTYDPAMQPRAVRLTMVCHKWNICWGILAGEGSACFNANR